MSDLSYFLKLCSLPERKKTIDNYEDSDKDNIIVIIIMIAPHIHKK